MPYNFLWSGRGILRFLPLHCARAVCSEQSVPLDAQSFQMTLMVMLEPSTQEDPAIIFRPVCWLKSERCPP